MLTLKSSFDLCCACLKLYPLCHTVYGFSHRCGWSDYESWCRNAWCTSTRPSRGNNLWCSKLHPRSACPEWPGNAPYTPSPVCPGNGSLYPILDSPLVVYQGYYVHPRGLQGETTRGFQSSESIILTLPGNMFCVFFFCIYMISKSHFLLRFKMVKQILV